MPKLIPPEVKAKAREMRAAGVSVPSIARELGIAKSTASRWVCDIPLSDTHRAALEARSATNPRSEAHRLGQLQWSRECRGRRRHAQLAGRCLGGMRDGDFSAGCMLYWAEGTKCRNQVRLANTDADLVAYFVRWLKEWFDVAPAQIRLSVNCFLNNGLTLDEIESWWLQKLELPPESLRQATVNRPGGSSKGAHRRHPYGTAHITVNSTYVLHAIYGGIQEITGIDRPEWLDIGVTVRGVG